MEPGIYSGVYTGKEICGFKKSHEYQFEVKHNGRTYSIHAFNDINNDDIVDLWMYYSSEISIKNNWEITYNNESESVVN